MSGRKMKIANRSNQTARRNRLFELIRQQDRAQNIAERQDDTLNVPANAMRLFALQAGATLRSEH